MALPYRSLARRLSLALSAAAWLPGTALAGVVALHQFAATAGGVYKLGATAKDEPIQAPDGSFFLATENGGTAGGCMGGVSGCGVVVQITGTMTKVIYNFPTIDNDLEFPVGALVQGPDGSLFGTTSGVPAPVGTGAVYKLTLQPSGAWMETTLHRFTNGAGCNAPIDGAIPLGRLVFGADGMLYGTTSQGGCVVDGTGGNAGPYGNQGTLFRLATDGSNYANIHNFNGSYDHADGAGPAAGLVLGAEGILFGTTHFGGAADAGTVFALNPMSLAVSVLHSFSGAAPDGGTPLGALTLGRDGNLWGTTFSGSGNDASYYGSVFKLAPGAPNPIVSYTFPADGAYSMPQAGVFQAGDGMFYGTTSGGGFYSITTAGVLTDLYTFPSVQTTTGPVAMPLQGSSGAIDVATSNGGPVTNGYTDRGGFFAYEAGVAKPKPVINFFLPGNNGAVGSTVVIGGANFVKASKVVFKGNAASATFSVNASGFISAVVPAGALTGFVRVTTLGGTAVSPVQFAVP